MTGVTVFQKLRKQCFRGSPIGIPAGKSCLPDFCFFDIFFISDL